MTTEILGFIIIVGAVIVLLARRQMQKADEDVEALEISADKLRRELEQSADEIIGRMAGHIDHLEKLLREADYKTDSTDQTIEYPERVIASGNIINLQAWNKVGRFDNSLFIDEVDHDFCHRLTQEKYKISFRIYEIRP